MNRSNVSGRAYTFVAACKEFNSGDPDKHGRMPLVLDPISGTSPRGINVISGTSGVVTGFEAGKIYLVKAVERESYEKANGDVVRSFGYTAMAPLSASEAMQSAKDGLDFVINPNLQDNESSEDTKASSKKKVASNA